MSAVWTDERIELLKALHKVGDSAGQMASALNRLPGQGISRNAVIGKAHRLGLGPIGGAKLGPVKRPTIPGLSASMVNARARAIRPPPPRKGEVKFATPNADGLTPQVPRMPSEPQRPDLERLEVLPPTACTLMTLGAHMCKWPIGDPADEEFRFCGQPVCEASEARARFYCKDHQQMSVTKDSPVKKSKRSPGAELARSLRKYIAA